MTAKANKPGSIPSGTFARGTSPPSPARPGGARQSRSPDLVTGAARICSKAGRAASFPVDAGDRRAQARHPRPPRRLAVPSECGNAAMRRMMRILGSAALLLPGFATSTFAAGAPPRASAAYTSPTTHRRDGGFPSRWVGGKRIWPARLESRDEADRQADRWREHTAHRREQLLWGNWFDQWDRHYRGQFLVGQMIAVAPAK